MSDTVNFDSQGSWTVGDGTSEMDVHKKGGRSKGQVQVNKPAPSGTQTAATTKPTGSSGALDLAALKKKAGGMKKTKAKPKVDAPVEAAKEETPPVKEEEKAPVVEVAPTPVEVPVVEEPVVEETPKVETPVEDAVTPESVEPEPPKEKKPLDLHGIKSNLKQMDLGEVTPKEDSTAGEKDVEPAPAKVEVAETQQEVTPAAPVVEAPTVAPKAFHIVSLEEFSVHATENQLLELARRAVKYILKHPTAVVASTELPNVRVYCVLPRNDDTSYVSFGVGDTITMASVNLSSGRVADVSSKMSCVGSCAIVDDAPVAHTGQVVAKVATV